MTDGIDVTIEGSVATLVLNRPEVRNAFNAGMISALIETCVELRRREDIRVVLLRGAGPVFSGGADARWLRESLEFTETQNLQDAGRMSDMYEAIDSLPQVVIGLIHGAALAGGMGLVAVCDIVLAAEGTIFGFTEAKLGIIPAVISRFVLPKIGRSWARALYLTGERFDTAVARQIGLVHWIATPDTIDEIVNDKVREVLSSGPNAARAAKCLLADLDGMSDMAVRDTTVRRMAELRVTPEAQEGLRAFLDKRPAAWRSDS